MDDNWIYLGIFLDNKSKKKLNDLYPLPVWWKKYYDHMTVVYNDRTKLANDIKQINVINKNIGKKFKLKVVAVGISERAYAVKVELPVGVVCANKITHITLGVAPIEGANAVDSNYITNWSKIYKNIYLTGEMREFKPTGGVLAISECPTISIDEANIY